MNALESGMVAVGFQRTGGEKEWCPCGPGIMEPGPGLFTDVLCDRIRVYRKQFFGESYTVRSWWDTPTVAVFASVAEFLEWCQVNGRPSLPGLPPYAQGMD